eukprot:EC789526.1.p3 GENE.EC789526.1~~EC789526.1.p3  ORF type:complete len:90 (+),score=20.05 EC789526.1:88-357(+)
MFSDCPVIKIRASSAILRLRRLRATARRSQHARLPSVKAVLASRIPLESAMAPFSSAAASQQLRCASPSSSSSSSSSLRLAVATTTTMT